VKAETRSEILLNAWDGINRLRAHGVTLFASGISVFLAILIGVPVVMVILMSLRTGFPGEQVPLTLENFVYVYANAKTYQILLNTVISRCPVFP
jgi:ABC-type spermidine/putrescine transport system permease subunit II